MENLNILFFENKPSTLQQIEDMLKGTEYNGRAKPRVVIINGSHNNLVKVTVGLATGFTYEWPHNNYYNLQTGCLDKKSKVKYHLAMRVGLLMIINADFIDLDTADNAMFEYILDSNGGWSWVIATQFIRKLTKLGLIRKDKLMLRSEDDVNEVVGNLFDKNSIYYLEPY